MIILDEQQLNELLIILKNNAPVRTGNLRSNGIQGIANIKNGLYMCQIGYPATGGYPATEDYALYTHTKNKTSKGWITRALNEWVSKLQSEFNNDIESGLDNDEL